MAAPIAAIEILEIIDSSFNFNFLTLLKSVLPAQFQWQALHRRE